MTLNIPTGLFDKYYEAVDGLIESDFIGKQSKVVYPPLTADCYNCTTNMIGGGTYTSVYRHGGPAPFEFGSCPLCGGTGFKQTEYSENIRLRIYWSRKDWLKFVPDINIPDATVMIIGYMSDVAKIKRASEILLVSDQTALDLRFTLAGEPFPHGFGKNRYFMAFLKRT